jgi:putative holliday junction resolvase
LPGRRPRGYHSCVRALAIDLGARRVGLAISDPSGVLARPLEVIEAGGAAQLARVAETIRRFEAEEDGLDLVVVGWPRRLDGSPNEQTAAVTAFVEALRAQIDQPVVLQDERLSSVEAESRLALRDRDWRSRKKKLDAAAAAVILQDYLDMAGQKIEDRR